MSPNAFDTDSFCQHRHPMLLSPLNFVPGAIGPLSLSNASTLERSMMLKPANLPTTPSDRSAVPWNAEIIDTITRGDKEAAELQILAAEEYVKSFLFKYDLDAIFGTAEHAPTHPSELIKKAVKIIASYYLVRLANPNVDIELYRKDYEDTISILRDLRDGNNNASLPYAKDDETTEEDESNSETAWDSNPKRNNFF